MADAKEDVYCTLLMSDSYLPGAAVLAHSLRDSGTTKKLAVLVTPDSLLYNTITQLKSLYDYVLPVEKLANPDVENLVRLGRLDLRFAFTKIALWRQEQFRKIVYIDADVVALRAPDELFKLDASFAAAPDIGWPDCFNSGVMVLSPNMGDYQSLQTMASSGTSFDGADQGLLNEYYGGRPWHRLSFAYNCTPSAGYQYEPAYRHFRSSISMAHFIGKDKPWTRGREALSSSASGVFKELLGRWWSVYDRHYKLSEAMTDKLSAEAEHISQFVKGETPPAPVQETEPKPEATATQEETFSAPSMEWDATRAEPPSESKPEAESFPHEKYQMSHDNSLYDNSKYQHPIEDKPKPLFPWEHADRAPASRKFIDHSKASSTTEDTTAASTGSLTPTALSPSGTGMTSPDPINSNMPRTNAWDNHSRIDAYVRAVQSQGKVGKVQVLFNNTDPPSDSTDPSQASTADIDPAQAPSSPPRRRESLILTDFPTELERPSLPVTPAPAARRPSFWNSERDDAGDLPSAEGVPEQSEWDPHKQLEALRRSSILTAQGDLPEGVGASAGEDATDLPRRDMVGTAAPMPAVTEAKEPAPVVPNGGEDEDAKAPAPGLVDDRPKPQAATAEEMSADDAYFMPKA